MSLLLLFSDQIVAAASGDAVTTMLIETGTGTWVDITSDLISGTIVRGRQNQLDQYQAGTAEVLLDNDDRKFDPTYASSPLNGYIRPMTRIQLRDTYGGITYPLFTGSADRWTQNREGPHRGTTSLSATDGFKNLERAQLGDSVWVNEMASAGPIAWWRFDDLAGSTALVDTVGGRSATIVGTPELGVDGLVTKDPSDAITIDATTEGAYTPLPAAPFITAAPLSLAVIVKTTDAGNNVLRLMSNSGQTVADLALSGTNAYFQMKNTSGTSTAAVAAGAINDGSPHLIVGVFDETKTVTVYVDGVATVGSTMSGTIDPISGVRIGGPTGFSLLATIDEAAVFNTALTAAQVSALSSARSAPWGGDLTGARINHVLDAIDWPALERDIDTGLTTLQTAELGMSALEHAQKTADTEFGSLYVTAGGVVRFEDRSQTVNQPVLFAFSDAAGAGLPVTFSNPEISDEQIRNDVTVSRLEGTAQNVRDATSIATYQIMSYTRDGLYNNSDSHSQYLAQHILAVYKDPAERVTNMVVNPYNNPATLWPAVLGIELTDRITLTETPQWVTPAVTRTLVVEGITHTFGPKTWTASFNVSENTGQTQAYWQLGRAGYSELGTTTRLGF